MWLDTTTRRSMALSKLNLVRWRHSEVCTFEVVTSISDTVHAFDLHKCALYSLRKDWEENGTDFRCGRTAAVYCIRMAFRGKIARDPCRTVSGVWREQEKQRQGHQRPRRRSRGTSRKFSPLLIPFLQSNVSISSVVATDKCIRDVFLPLSASKFLVPQSLI